MTKRLMLGNEFSCSRVADHAISGAEKAIPVRAANTTAGTRPHVRVSGNSTNASATPVPVINALVVCHSAIPPAI